MLKPKFKTIIKEKNDHRGIFLLEPLEKGFGHTLGNALRRCLLSSIKGRAITAVKISGVKHQFSTLEGLKEDIVELVLNLKHVIIEGETDEPVVLKISAKGPKTVTAKDIKTPANIKIVNKNLELVNLANSKAKLDCEIYSEVGLGYNLAEEYVSDTVGLIPVDASFSPIVQVNYKIEAARVGQRTDFDRLILEIVTNGSVDSEKVLKQAAKNLVAYFKQIYDPVAEEVVKETKAENEENSEALDLTVEELDLPTRIANALRKGGFPTVRDLVSAKPEEVAKVKNLGSKSLSIIKEKLKNKEIEIFQG